MTYQGLVSSLLGTLLLLWKCLSTPFFGVLLIVCESGEIRNPSEGDRFILPSGIKGFVGLSFKLDPPVRAVLSFKGLNSIVFPWAWGDTILTIGDGDGFPSNLIDFLKLAGISP